MARIKTLIPVHWMRRLTRYWNQTLFDRIWQLFLVIVGSILVYAALSSGAVFVTAVAGIVLSYVLADDIRATIQNIWNRQFWVWKV